MSEAERRELVDSAYFMIEHGVKGIDVPLPSHWTVAQLEGFQLWTRAVTVPHGFVEHVTALVCSVAGMGNVEQRWLLRCLWSAAPALWIDASR
jgi:hypothetical protein